MFQQHTDEQTDRAETHMLQTEQLCRQAADGVVVEQEH